MDEGRGGEGERGIERGIVRGIERGGEREREMKRERERGRGREGEGEGEGESERTRGEGSSLKASPPSLPGGLAVQRLEPPHGGLVLPLAGVDAHAPLAPLPLEPHRHPGPDRTTTASSSNTFRTLSFIDPMTWREVFVRHVMKRVLDPHLLS